MPIPEQTKELIQDLNRSYALELAEQLSPDELEALLAEKVNRLIREDFGALVQLLYRVDVSEGKLRAMLAADAEPGSGSEGSGSEAGGGNVVARSGGGEDAGTGTAGGGEDAGRIIARLIMERQWQKIETRQRYSAPREEEDGEEFGEERW
jgi:hypothetical protein